MLLSMIEQEDVKTLQEIEQRRSLRRGNDIVIVIVIVIVASEINHLTRLLSRG